MASGPGWWYRKEGARRPQVSGRREVNGGQRASGLAREKPKEPPRAEAVATVRKSRVREFYPRKESESGTIFRTLAETTPAGIFVHQAGRFCYANPAAEALSGYRSDELAAMNFWDIVHPDFRELVRERGLARERGEVVPARYELKIVTKSGEERWVDLSATSIEFNGKPAVLGTAFDITERKRAETALREEMAARSRLEAELRESREQLQAVLDNSTAVIYAKDLEGKYLLVNRCYEKLFEIPREDIVGRTDYDIFPAEVARRLRMNDEEVVRAGMPLEFEESILQRDGPHVYISLKFPLRDTGGAMYAVCGISTDITERKQAKEALEQSEAHYRTLVETAHEVIWALDTEGRLTFVNKECQKLLGYEREEVIGRPFSDFVEPAEVERNRAIFEATLAGRDYRDFETIVVGRNGRRVAINVNGAALRSASGEVVGVMGTAQDVTERKRVDAMKRNFSRRLLQTLENERRRVARELHDSVGQTLATLGLQINALLQESEGLSQGARRKLKEVGHRVRDATEAVARLARDNLPAELSDLGVSSAIESFACQFADRHGLDLMLEVGRVDGLLEEDQELHLYRIVQEALNNVAKHAEASQVRVAIAQMEDRIVGVVEDDGRGFDTGHLDRGLGFTTMTERAAMLGGTLDIRSAVGEGTRVEVSIPFRKDTTGSGGRILH